MNSIAGQQNPKNPTEAPMERRTSPISPPITDLIELFRLHLMDVEFPDINAAKLSELGCKVEAAHIAVVELEKQLSSARGVCTEVERALLRTSQTALGYAKIYADGNEELSTALAAISIGKKRKASETGTRRPRSKVVKAKTQQTDLPLSGANPEERQNARAS